jgi:hypothetical protein
MIILPEPNNDIWIYDDYEWKSTGIPYENIVKSREKIIEAIPQHEYKEFCHILIGEIDPTPERTTWVFPRKYTNFMGGHFDINFSFLEIFDSLCERKKVIDNIYIYEMPWKEVFVFYTGTDSGGYDSETRTMLFKNKKEYNEKFYLP